MKKLLILLLLLASPALATQDLYPDDEDTNGAWDFVVGNDDDSDGTNEHWEQIYEIPYDDTDYIREDDGSSTPAMSLTDPAEGSGYTPSEYGNHYVSCRLYLSGHVSKTCTLTVYLNEDTSTGGYWPTDTTPADVVIDWKAKVISPGFTQYYDMDDFDTDDIDDIVDYTNLWLSMTASCDDPQDMFVTQCYFRIPDAAVSRRAIIIH
jgi:hypothetical protein